MSESAAPVDPNRKLSEEAKKAVEATGLPLLTDSKTNDPLYVSSRDLPLKFLIPVAKVKPFFDALREGRLTATKCASCGAMYFPPQSECSSCGSQLVEYVPLSQDAELLAYTMINVKPFSFLRYEDYIVAIGRLPEGVNVLAWLKGVTLDKAEVGMKLTLKVGTRESDGVCTYWFVPT